MEGGRRPSPIHPLFPNKPLEVAKGFEELH